MTKLSSQRLELRTDAEGDVICCRGCGKAIAAAGDPWKPNARLRERMLCDVAPIYTTNDDLLLREFVCPGCGALLDSEIALPDDPFLQDRLAT